MAKDHPRLIHREESCLKTPIIIPFSPKTWLKHYKLEAHTQSCGPFLVPCILILLPNSTHFFLLISITQSN